MDSVSRLIVAALGIAAAGCVFASSAPPSPGGTASCRDIDAVLRAHDEELMAVPGVVGVYIGLSADGKTPCLRVMAAEHTPELERRIPKSIEGCPVVIEETGPIQPLPGRLPSGRP